MSLTLSLAVYFICWWIVLLAVLPLRIGAQQDPHVSDPHAEASGAPPSPNLPLKFGITTAVATVVFIVVYAVVALKLIDIDKILVP